MGRAAAIRRSGPQSSMQRVEAVLTEDVSSDSPSSTIVGRVALNFATGSPAVFFLLFAFCSFCSRSQSSCPERGLICLPMGFALRCQIKAESFEFVGSGRRYAAGELFKKMWARTPPTPPPPPPQPPSCFNGFPSILDHPDPPNPRFSGSIWTYMLEPSP